MARNSALSSGEDTLVRLVRSLEGDLVDLAVDLIRIPSVNPELEPGSSEGPANRLVAERMSQFGLTIEEIPSGSERPNVVGHLPGAGGGRSLALNGHIDTVPAGDPAQWTVPPFEGLVRDGYVWGRGSCDMKGALAAMITAARAIGEMGVPLAGDISVQSVVGEELFDPAGTRTLLDGSPHPQACVCGEPTADQDGVPGLAIDIVSAPVLLLRVKLDGQSTHTALRYQWIHPSRNPFIGANAVEYGADLVRSLLSLEQEWGATKLHPMFPPGKFVIQSGYIQGGPLGGGPYLPAEQCVVECVVWHHPDETPAEVRAEIEGWIVRWAQTHPWLREHPPTIEWWGEFPHFSLASDHPLIDVVAGAHRAVTKDDGCVAGFPAGCDATFLTQAGVPTVVYGPGELRMAHAPDERVLVSELVQAAAVYAVTFMRWCSDVHDR